jgi:hypothetical protein
MSVGIATTLAWQSYSGAAKRVFASNVPELGWSPEARQIIASWVDQLGWRQSVQEPPHNFRPKNEDANGRPFTRARARPVCLICHFGTKRTFLTL